MGKDLEHIFLRALEDSQDKLFRICLSYTHGTEEAKDLFQEVLINIWQALPGFKGNSSLSTWMYRITLNIALRHRANLSKEKRRFSSIEGAFITVVESPGQENPEREKLLMLRKCVRALNESDIGIITLYLEGLPYKEISNITGLKENTIAVKLKRIKKKLFNCINQEE